MPLGRGSTNCWLFTVRLPVFHQAMKPSRRSTCFARDLVYYRVPFRCLHAVLLLVMLPAMGDSAMEERLEIAKRSEAAILGAYVADNAVMGLHWVYDTDEIRGALKASGTHPEWHSPPASKYYSYKTGQPTPYGEEFTPRR